MLICSYVVVVVRDAFRQGSQYVQVHNLADGLSVFTIDASMQTAVLPMDTVRHACGPIVRYRKRIEEDFPAASSYVEVLQQRRGDGAHSAIIERQHNNTRRKKHRSRAIFLALVPFALSYRIYRYPSLDVSEVRVALVATLFISIFVSYRYFDNVNGKAEATATSYTTSAEMRPFVPPKELSSALSPTPSPVPLVDDEFHQMRGKMEKLEKAIGSMQAEIDKMKLEDNPKEKPTPTSSPQIEGCTNTVGRNETGLAASDLLDETHTGIPHIIHQSWKTKDLPFKFERWSGSWRTYNQNWRWILWTNEDNLAICERYFPWFLEKFKSMKGEIYRADLSRNMYLYLYGGVYADLDQEALRPIQPLFTKAKANTEKYFDRTSGNVSTATSVAYTGTMGGGGIHSMPNAWMASTPEHPLWLFPLITALERKDGGAPEEISGPIALFKSYEIYESLMKKENGEEAVWDYIKEKLGTSWRGMRKVRHAAGVFRQQFIFPHAWTRSLPVCSIGNAKFKPSECKAELKTEENESYAVTYWSHSWTESDSNSGRVDFLKSKDKRKRLLL
ncbi:glycosyltransferase family 32 protein [Planoprotostelium fungivorum]|uniref:Glycosyltransferase family 32 protein n=1 Tax=Planoprotostelium fungivorum TaxID=1890364 RepID=A0A2P6MXW5_9EUKA|nr:glycosyltransferase family 32 protein [Planoprotostelium fungivorum]